MDATVSDENRRRKIQWIEFSECLKLSLVIYMETAAELGMSGAAIEKDLWVCFVLSIIFSDSNMKDIFRFKGGTSLSKAYGLIHRFSEDIDLILDWRKLGFSKDEPWQKRSNTAQDKFNKEANTKAALYIRNEIFPIFRDAIRKSLEAEPDLIINPIDPQTIIFRYPNVFKSQYLSPSIRLEIGPLASWTPTENRPIQPYIADVFPEVFSEMSFIVETVLPERTFWEKATVLHHEANRPLDSIMPARYARHYYDLFMMTKSDVKDKAFRNLQLLDDVIAFKTKFYPRKWAEYEKAVPATIRIVPPKERIAYLMEDYENMKEMLFGKKPSFREILEGLEQLENEMHKL